MNILYKYYSPNLDIIKYLKNPTVKLTSTKTFNDPFEMNIAKPLAKMIAESFIKLISTDEGYYYGSAEEYINEFKTMSRNYGVISLTETHRNILMWAHYASSHEGFCIGYRSDFLSTEQSVDKNNSAHNLNPHRVIYDKRRFDPSNYSHKNTLHDLMIQAMTIKSDEWIYEKEHRCIVSKGLANRFIISGKVSQNTAALINRMIKDGHIKETDEEHTYLFNPQIPSSSIGSVISRDRIANIEDIVLLKDIDIKSIRSIYFGCKANTSTINDALKIIESSPAEYGHISVYRYSLNDDEFDLDLECLINEPPELNIESALFNFTF
ncbi:DUF2971 domain-containing protein [Aeromonas hydrophila]